MRTETPANNDIKSDTRQVVAAGREHNANISRTRVRVENRFANMKRFQILRTWRGRNMDNFEPILSAVAALSTLPA